MISYNELIGIPFDPDGDSLKGINCYNLVRKAFALHKIIIPTTDISVCACREASNKEIEAHIMRYWKILESGEEPPIPCGIVIQSVTSQYAHHVGTFIGNNKILHVTQNTYSIIENLYPKYKTRVLGLFKFIGDNS